MFPSNYKKINHDDEKEDEKTNTNNINNTRTAKKDNHILFCFVLFGIRVVQKYGPRYVMLLHTSLDQQGPASSDFLSLDYLHYSTSGS